MKNAEINFEAFCAQLKGIEVEKVYQQLLDEGLKAFKESFTDLLQTLKR